MNEAFEIKTEEEMLTFVKENREKLLQQKKEWYSKEVKFEIIKAMKHRELSMITPRCDAEHKRMVRYLIAFNIDYLEKHFRRYEFDKVLANLYQSVAVLKDIPVFSYNPKERKSDPKYIDFNHNYDNFIVGYDLFIDFDSEFNWQEALSQLKIAKKVFDDYKLPYYCLNSVTGDTPILIRTSRNIELNSIQEIVKKLKNGKKIQALSFDRKNYKIKFSDIYAYHQSLEDVYKIKYNFCPKPLLASKDHSVMILDNCCIIEKKTSELKKGDYLITFQMKKKDKKRLKSFKYNYILRGQKVLETINLSDGFLRLIGYYLGDGHLSMKRGEFGFSFNSQKDKKYIKDVQKIISNLSHTNHYIDQYNKIKKLKKRRLKRKEIVAQINASEAFTENCLYSNNIPKKRKINQCLAKKTYCKCSVIIANSIKIREFFKQYCGKYSHFKKLPFFVWNLNKHQIFQILQGYINSDGTKTLKYDYKIFSVSKRLIYEWCWLLKSIGINCYIQKKKIPPHLLPQGKLSLKKTEGYEINISKAYFKKIKLNKFSPEKHSELLPTKWLKQVYQQCKPTMFNYHRREQMTLSKNLASRKRIKLVINWFEKYKSKNFNKKSLFCLKQYKKLIQSEIGISRITKITKLKRKRKLYDISVKNCENFFGGEYPILLHNSSFKGFHLRIPYNYMPKLPIKDLIVLINDAMYNFKGIYELSAIDLSIFDSKRICKVPSSLSYDGAVCLPLSDEQLENYHPKIITIKNVLANVHIRDRGNLLRKHGLDDLQLEKNVKKFFKDFAS